MWGVGAGKPVIVNRQPQGPDTGRLCRRTAEDSGPYEDHAILLRGVFTGSLQMQKDRPCVPVTGRKRLPSWCHPCSAVL